MKLPARDLMPGMTVRVDMSTHDYGSRADFGREPYLGWREVTLAQVEGAVLPLEDWPEACPHCPHLIGTYEVPGFWDFVGTFHPAEMVEVVEPICPCGDPHCSLGREHGEDS